MIYKPAWPWHVWHACIDANSHAYVNVNVMWVCVHCAFFNIIVLVSPSKFHTLLISGVRLLTLRVCTQVYHWICVVFTVRYSRGGRGGRGRGGRGRGGRGRGRGKGPVPTAEELDAELDAYNKQVCSWVSSIIFFGFILVASTQTEPMESWTSSTMPTSWNYNRSFISYFLFSLFIEFRYFVLISRTLVY